MARTYTVEVGPATISADRVEVAPSRSSERPARTRPALPSGAYATVVSALNLRGRWPWGRRRRLIVFVPEQGDPIKMCVDGSGAWVTCVLHVPYELAREFADEYKPDEGGQSWRRGRHENE